MDLSSDNSIPPSREQSPDFWARGRPNYDPEGSGPEPADIAGAVTEPNVSTAEGRALRAASSKRSEGTGSAGVMSGAGIMSGGDYDSVQAMAATAADPPAVAAAAGGGSRRFSGGEADGTAAAAVGVEGGGGGAAVRRETLGGRLRADGSTGSAAAQAVGREASVGRGLAGSISPRYLANGREARSGGTSLVRASSTRAASAVGGSLVVSRILTRTESGHSSQAPDGSPVSWSRSQELDSSPRAAPPLAHQQSPLGPVHSGSSLSGRSTGRDSAVAMQAVGLAVAMRSPRVSADDAPGPGAASAAAEMAAMGPGAGAKSAQGSPAKGAGSAAVSEHGGATAPQQTQTTTSMPGSMVVAASAVTNVTRNRPLVMPFGERHPTAQQRQQQQERGGSAPAGLSGPLPGRTPMGSSMGRRQGTIRHGPAYSQSPLNGGNSPVSASRDSSYKRLAAAAQQQQQQQAPGGRRPERETSLDASAQGPSLTGRPSLIVGEDTRGDLPPPPPLHPAASREWDRRPPRGAGGAGAGYAAGGGVAAVKAAAAAAAAASATAPTAADQQLQQSLMLGEAIRIRGVHKAAAGAALSAVSVSASGMGMAGVPGRRGRRIVSHPSTTSATAAAMAAYFAGVEASIAEGTADKVLLPSGLARRLKAARMMASGPPPFQRRRERPPPPSPAGIKLDGFMLLEAADEEMPEAVQAASLESRHISAVESADLSYFVALRTLDVSDNKLPDLICLANLQALVRLRAASCRLHTLGMWPGSSSSAAVTESGTSASGLESAASAGAGSSTGGGGGGQRSRRGSKRSSMLRLNAKAGAGEDLAVPAVSIAETAAPPVAAVLEAGPAPGSGQQPGQEQPGQEQPGQEQPAGEAHAGQLVRAVSGGGGGGDEVAETEAVGAPGDEASKAAGEAGAEAGGAESSGTGAADGDGAAEGRVLPTEASMAGTDTSATGTDTVSAAAAEQEEPERMSAAEAASRVFARAGAEEMGSAAAAAANIATVSPAVVVKAVAVLPPTPPPPPPLPLAESSSESRITSFLLPLPPNPFQFLEVLDLSYNQLQPHMVLLPTSPLAQLPRLTELDLSSNHLKALPSPEEIMAAAAAAAVSAAVRMAAENGTALSGPGPGAAAGGVAFPALRRLRLADNSLKASAIASLATLAPPHLSHLDLSRNAISEAPRLRLPTGDSNGNGNGNNPSHGHVSQQAPLPGQQELVFTPRHPHQQQEHQHLQQLLQLPLQYQLHGHLHSQQLQQQVPQTLQHRKSVAEQALEERQQEERYAAILTRLLVLDLTYNKVVTEAAVAPLLHLPALQRLLLAGNPIVVTLQRPHHDRLADPSPKLDLGQPDPLAPKPTVAASLTARFARITETAPKQQASTLAVAAAATITAAAAPERVTEAFERMDATIEQWRLNTVMEEDEEEDEDDCADGAEDRTFLTGVGIRERRRQDSTPTPDEAVSESLGTEAAEGEQQQPASAPPQLPFGDENGEERPLWESISDPTERLAVALGLDPITLPMHTGVLTTDSAGTIAALRFALAHPLVEANDGLAPHPHYTAATTAAQLKRKLRRQAAPPARLAPMTSSLSAAAMLPPAAAAAAAAAGGSTSGVKAAKIQTVEAMLEGMKGKLAALEASLAAQLAAAPAPSAEALSRAVATGKDRYGIPQRPGDDDDDGDDAGSTGSALPEEVIDLIERESEDEVENDVQAIEVETGNMDPMQGIVLLADQLAAEEEAYAFPRSVSLGAGVVLDTANRAASPNLGTSTRFSSPPSPPSNPSPQARQQSLLRQAASPARSGTAASGAASRKTLAIGGVIGSGGVGGGTGAGGPNAGAGGSAPFSGVGAAAALGYAA